MKEKGLSAVIYLSLIQITLSSSLSKSKIQRTTAELDALLSDARPWLYRLALAITALPETAEDVAQEALVRAAHSREKLRTTDEPKAWLRTVLVLERLLEVPPTWVKIVALLVATFVAS